MTGPASESSRGSARVFAAFDDPNLIAHAELVPVVRLAERCGLPDLVAEKVRLTGAANGADTAADAKAMSIVGGMAAGAGSIDDLDILRRGGLPKLFGGSAGAVHTGHVLAGLHLGACASTGVCRTVHLRSGHARRGDTSG
ncbi:hypothetical protein ACFYMW_30620 [Streptomyces sp. NPDC006692]|uniref:hypothetical protein n=1 Tax=Streptomyces sp. NPDC006692 TaxID=3364758 RepID=UPI0036A37743